MRSPPLRAFCFPKRSVQAVSRSSSALQAVLRAPQREEQRSAPPPDRGRLLTAAQVATDLFHGTVSATWVRRSVPNKVVLGHSTIRWYVYDVQAWISARRSDQQE